MEINTLKLHYGGKPMPWGKACVVTDFKGLVFLGGVEGIDPDTRIKDSQAEVFQPVFHQRSIIIRVIVVTSENPLPAVPVPIKLKLL